MLYYKRLFLLTLTCLFVSACSPSKNAKNIGQTAIDSSPCTAFETFLHDQAQVAIEEDGSLPTLDDVRAGFEDALDISYPDTDSDLLEKLVDDFVFFYAFLFEETDALPNAEEKSKFLISLEMGTHQDLELQAEYDRRISAYVEEAELVFNTCIEPKENPNIIPPEEETKPSPVDLSADDHVHEYGEGPYFSAIENATDLAVFGALKTFATAYQSCEAISLEALGIEDENLDGVIRNGSHPNGIGGRRYIASLSKVQNTHPYIQSVIDSGGGGNSSCFNTYQKPLIYDYGGKPHFTSSTSDKLNFFKDGGSGTDELGTDCSGYIYTSLMTAGLKLDPDKPIRVRGVIEIPASHYKNLGSKMRCFEKVKAGKNEGLIAGDILASSGHIFIVDWASEDPLGANDKTSNNECDEITHEDFDFTIMQSSPSKGAIGINRMQAADYLDGSSSMRKAMVSFARTHCKQRLAGNVMTPNHSSASLIRHKMTPECVSKERIKLNGETCLDTCSF